MKSLYKIHHLLLFSLFLLLFVACKNDAAYGDADSELLDSLGTSISLEEAPDEKAIIEEMSKMDEDLPVNEKAKVEDITDVKLEEKSEAEKRKEEELKRKIAEEKVKKSDNKGQSCKEILKKYEAIANDFLDSNDIKLLVKMNEQTNDVFFAKCREDQSFQKSIDAINAKVDAALE